MRGPKGRGSKSHHRPSYDGFQLLTRGGGKSKSLFEDDDEGDLERDLRLDRLLLSSELEPLMFRFR